MNFPLSIDSIPGASFSQAVTSIQIRTPVVIIENNIVSINMTLFTCKLKHPNFWRPQFTNSITL